MRRSLWELRFPGPKQRFRCLEASSMSPFGLSTPVVRMMRSCKISCLGNLVLNNGGCDKEVARWIASACHVMDLLNTSI